MSQNTSPGNPKIKLARALRGRKARQESGLFLVEGIHHIGAAMQAGADIRYLIQAPELLDGDFARQLVAELSGQDVPCYSVSRTVFASLADKDNPQGLLAIVRQPAHLLHDLTPQNFPWGTALVDPQDPGNLGAILRTIDAVNASGLLLLSSAPDQAGLVDPFHPSAVRASMGAIFWRPIVRADFSQFTRWAQIQGYHIYGTSAHGDLDFRWLETYQLPAILLLGSERAGLAPEQAGVCQSILRLPMTGHVTSLNLSVAAGVLLYDMLAKLRSLAG
jgi:RNA methyltransferase, TrmH family